MHDHLAVLAALRRAKIARRAAQGLTHSPDERQQALGRARQWLLLARILNQSALRRQH